MGVGDFSGGGDYCVMLHYIRISVKPTPSNVYKNQSVLFTKKIVNCASKKNNDAFQNFLAVYTNSYKSFTIRTTPTSPIFHHLTRQCTETTSNFRALTGAGGGSAKCPLHHKGGNEEHTNFIR